MVSRRALWDGNKLEHCLDQSLLRPALFFYSVPVAISYPAATSVIRPSVPDLGHFNLGDLKHSGQGGVGVCCAVL